jgi:osmotically-inducible protein OsmY
MKMKPKTASHLRSDSAIAADVRQALKLDSDVPDERITVQVHDGLVTLDGTLDASFQKEAAEADALKGKRVRGVTNRIHV